MTVIEDESKLHQPKESTDELGTTSEEGKDPDDENARLQ